MPHLHQDELDRRIVYEDAGVVVVDKPWGLPSTGRRLQDPDSLQYALQQRYVRMVWAVHQLDADTSGLNVFVLQRPLVRVWQLRMRFPVGHKSYLAILHGVLDGNRTVDTRIGPLPDHPAGGHGVTPTGRLSRSHFELLDRVAGFSLVRVRIETGRTHQIRIHASSLGHPLVGEAWYRTPPCRRHLRQALHAAELRFDDGGTPALLHCPPSPDLVELADSLGLRLPRVSPLP